MNTPSGCSNDANLLPLFSNDACGTQQLADADQNTCSLYKSAQYQNPVFQCLARECGEFNVSLLACCLLFGGLIGGVFLFLINGCSLQPPGELKFRKRKLEREDRDDAKDMYNQISGNDDTGSANSQTGNSTDADGNVPGSCDSDDHVDLLDGIFDGEDGVIIQIIANYLSRKEKANHDPRLKTLAKMFKVMELLKKLALKIVVIVPLVLNHNIISVAPYAIDVVVFFYFGAMQTYFPGSLYNEVHALVTGRKFKKVHAKCIVFFTTSKHAYYLHESRFEFQCSTTSLNRSPST